MQLNSKKKILLIGPRLHTNYIGQIQSLLANNYEVHFLAKKKNHGENHSYVKPVILKESIFSRLRKKIYGNIGSNNSQYFPNILKFILYVKKVRPDYSIIRFHGRLFTYFCAFVLKFYKSRIFFYDQFDISNVKLPISRRIEYFICYKLLNIKIISPICSNKNEIKENFSFIPFCSEIVKKKKFNKGKIKILSVGKFQKRKNHFLLINAIADISKKINLELNIVGEYQTLKEKKYKKKVFDYIKFKKLNKIIKVHNFIPHKEIFKFYKKFDFFVLPAENEIASVSIIEALGYGLPVICSDDCGTKNYVKNNYNGFFFKKNNIKSLKAKIKLISNRDKIKKFSFNAYTLSKKNISKDYFILLFNKMLSS